MEETPVMEEPLGREFARRAIGEGGGPPGRRTGREGVVGEEG